ncbi:hypothetical protein AGOR_G00040580 [Albula goreensis]|uniref:Uncharacterized protein n=1 Tax=Albula goreensis TaxID=1534307 RepID=A0A8T3E1B5_9TELE|nr:hypothetical protein AGOR_G00040580 [Albula goreensis]
MMSNYVAFHAQLTSIMEVLTKAAIAEICELVDDGYAVLHLEISRSHKENEALKRKLRLMELKIARASGERRREIVNLVKSRSVRGVQVCDEFSVSSRVEDHIPTPERDFSVGSQPGVSLWRDAELSVVDKEEAPVMSNVHDESPHMEKEEGPKTLCIKKEGLDEDLENSDAQRGMKVNEERPLESDGGEKSPIVDTQTVPATSLEELTEQQRTRPGVWEDNELDEVLKAEPEMDISNPQDTAERLKNHGSDYALYEKPGQLDTFFSRGNSETETEGPACSYSPATSSDSPPSHSERRLASIMEVLANAAVAEICELVDDGYAVLHLEISRRQKENEALKRKLQLMELRISQRCVDKPRVRILDEIIGASEDAELTSEDIADNQLDLSAWREEESTSMDAEKTPIKPDECADKEKGRPESVLIKKEKLEEDMVSSDPQGGLTISAERGREADGVEKVAIVVTHTVLATGTEDVAEKQRTKNSVWEDSGLDAVLKAEPENDNVTLQDTGSEHIVEKNNLGNEHVMYERAGQLDTFYTRGFAEKEAEGPACSYAPATDSGSFSGHSDLQPILPAGSDEMLPGWSKEPMSGMVQTQQRRYKEDRRRERLQLGNVLFPPRTHLPAQESVASKSGSPDVNGWAPCDDHFAKSKSAKFE